MFVSIFDLLAALENSDTHMRTLRDAELCRGESGEPCCAVGNSALVVKIRTGGRIRKLRCYLRPKRNLAAIYRDRFLAAEMALPSRNGKECRCDAVLEEWIEGECLETALRKAVAAGDKPRLKSIAAGFDRFAVELLAQEWAHGDLKPDNLIVDPSGGIHAIDFDAMYRPDFPAECCEESGTRIFQHPTRTAATFDKGIDDYPIAILSATVNALALDPSIWELCEAGDFVLIDPALATSGRDSVLERIETLFARAGDALHYRVARLLRSRHYRLAPLAALLGCAVHGVRERSGTLTLDQREGRWGYRDDAGFVIPPVYDCGFEFSEGLAAVRTGGFWHFIDEGGRVAVDCSDCEAVSPFRDGAATVVRNGRRTKIDRNGAEVAF